MVGGITMRYALLRFSACAALLIALQAAPAHGDTWDRLTYFTFSGPVQLPGVTLAAGTYEFKVADPMTGGNAIVVSSQNGDKMRRIFLTNRGIQLPDTADDPMIVLRETPAGAPPALQGWFYPGESTGFEFIYSHRQKHALAASGDSRVRAAT